MKTNLCINLSGSQVYRHSLDSSSKKFYCPNPNCGKKRFVRYIDNSTGEYLSDDCGRCDRHHKCGYHLPPKIWFESHPDKKPNNGSYKKLLKPIAKQKVNHIPTSYLSRSLQKYSDNNFIIWLRSKFNDNHVDQVVKLYVIGSAKIWPGSTVFWQVDIDRKVRQGKVIQYNSTTGSRNKKLGCLFIGKRLMKELNISEPNLKQTFFGAHLVKKYPNKIVGIVESEKTALLMTLYAMMQVAPDYLYIATGGSSGCRWYETEVNSFLQYRDVVIIPDLGQHDKWKEKSAFLKARSVTVTRILEEVCSVIERSEGYDIADFYLEEHNNLSPNQNPKLSIASWEEITLNSLLKKNPSLQLMIDTFQMTPDL